VIVKEFKLAEKKKDPKVANGKKDWRLLQPRQMITRARRRSFDYKDMVKTIEEVCEQDEEDPIIRLAMLDGVRRRGHHDSVCDAGNSAQVTRWRGRQIVGTP
jgi:hypothetical protein